MPYLVEIDAYDPATSSVRTLRFATEGVATLPTDEVPNTFYEPRVSQPGSYERSMFSSGTTSGESSVAAGIVELVNNDGGLDYMRALAFDGRAIRVMSIESGAPFFSRQMVFTGIVEQAEVSWSRITLRMRDRLQALKALIQGANYLGTTIAGGVNTAEGKPDDLKGQPKPLAFGRVLNVPLVTANAFDLIYQGADNAISSVEAVYDRGVALTRVGTSYADIAAMRAATVGAGQYAVCLSPFYVRLGSQPAGQVTADFSEGAATSDRTVGRIVTRILTRSGFFAGTHYRSSDLTALDAAASAEAGIWIGTEPIDILQVLSELLNSVGAYISPDRVGVYRIGQFAAPVGPAALTLTAVDLIDEGSALELIASNDESKGIPAWRVALTYGKIYAVQDANALAGSVTEARRAFLATATRTAYSENAATKTTYLLSPEITGDTLLVTEAAATAEAARRRALYGVTRDLVRVRLDSRVATPADLGKSVTITVPRFGFNAGKLFTVLGIDDDFAANRTTLTLWG